MAEVDEVDGNCFGKSATKSDDEEALGNEASGQISSNNNIPTDSPSHYNMNHKNRGIALIFSHETFTIKDENNQTLDERRGTEKDCRILKDTLEWLKFKVILYKNLKYRDIIANLKDIANADHSKNDCLCVTVLSHGDRDGTVSARDQFYKLYSLWDYFADSKCPSLAGKPKLFFAQTCRGNQYDPGVKLIKTQTDFPEIHGYAVVPPLDFLVMYATVEGYYSWRTPTKGTCFIQTLCKELYKSGRDTSLLTVLTFVSKSVAIDFESNVPGHPVEDKQKQIPCIVSTLTKLVQFN